MKFFMKILPYLFLMLSIVMVMCTVERFINKDYLFATLDAIIALYWSHRGFEKLSE